jgi:hypothetical protein
LAAVSSSISGTVTFNSSSVSGTIGNVSASVSGTIGNVSSSVSGTITTLSGSVSGTIGVLSGSVSGTIGVLSGSISSSITTLSSSVSQSVYQSLLTSFARVQRLADGNYSGSFIGDNIIYSPVLGGQLGYFSTLFKVGQSPNSIYLDARQTPRKIFIGGAVPSGDTEASGAYNNINTPVYFDSTGKLSLGNKLSWNGVDTLSITGNLNVGSSVPNSVVTGLKALALKDSVSATEIDAGAVTEAKIGSGAVSNAKLANNIRQFTQDNFTANGAGQTFTLTDTPLSANTLMVTVDGIYQTAPVNYTITGNTLIFTGVPPASSNVAVKHLGFRTTTTVTALPAGSVTTIEIADGAVTDDKLAVSPLTNILMLAGM